MPTNVRDDRKVMNLAEAAKFIRVSGRTLRQLARSKRIPCQKVGREWRFLLRSLQQWLAGPAAVSQLAEHAEVYGQLRLFPQAVTADERPSGAAFGDTAFTNNRREPLHRWVPWIAGFSAAFVEEVLNRVVPGDPRDATVLDPFAGVGTTLVEGLKRGHNVVGFEINPYAALACDVKLSCMRCSLKRLIEGINDLEELWRSEWVKHAQPTSKPPGNFRGRSPFFSPAVEHQVLLLQDFIADQTNGFVRNVLRLALGSVMVGFSNYSYEPSLSTRSAAGKSDVEYADVRKVFCDKLWEMVADIGFMQRHMKRFERMPAAEIYHRSYFDSSSLLAPCSFDVLITSPPYLNNYHYVRNTRPQLYWLNLVGGNQDLKKLEQQSFGQFWQTVRGAPPIELAFDLPELEQVLQCVRERNPERGTYGGTGWANYAATYFNDCNRFFRVTRRVMKPGGLAVVVIGNNILQGVHIETDRFLAQIGELHGFSVEGMHRVRRKRTGSSIVNSSVRAGVAAKRIELYETAVELRAPQ